MSAALPPDMPPVEASKNAVVFPTCMSMCWKLAASYKGLEDTWSRGGFITRDACVQNKTVLVQ